jgi:ammonia channel protein AmtB
VITATVLGAALAAGLYFTAVDANPRFDDTGILAGLIVLTAGALSAVRPRAALIVGMLVGLPIPVVELIRSDFERWAALAALGLALAGAFAGAYIGIIVRRTAQQAT